ncbi:MAG: hypothetical protein AAF654_04230 [Myxococcota bacterium]
MAYRVSACVFASALFLSGCGSDDLSEDEAQEAFAAAFGVSLVGASQASISADASGNTTATFNCAGGGTATISGTTDDDGEVFNFSIAYSDCNSEGITINGTITYAGSSTTSGGTEDVSFTMTGTLDFTGSVEGQCEVDVSWQSSVNDSGASFDFSGSICGFDASDGVFTAGI